MTCFLLKVMFSYIELCFSILAKKRHVRKEQANPCDACDDDGIEDVTETDQPPVSEVITDWSLDNSISSSISLLLSVFFSPSSLSIYLSHTHSHNVASSLSLVVGVAGSSLSTLISLFSSPLQQHKKAEGHIGAEEGQYTLYCIVFKRSI